MTEIIRQPLYAFEGFRLDACRRILCGADGQPIALTPRLFDTLLYLVDRPGQLLTKEQLLEALWPSVVVEEHNLNKNISELRRVLGEKRGENRFIATIPGRGYRFVAEVSVAPDPTIGEGSTPATLGTTASQLASQVKAGEAAAANHQGDGGTRRWPLAWWVAGASAIAVAAAVTVFGFQGELPEAPLRITPWSVKKGTQWFPAWSPDSASTAFVTFGGPSRERPELVIRDLDQPIGRSIAQRGQPGGFAQWATTGKLLFLQPDGLWSISPVGGPPERVAQLDFAALGIPQSWLRMVAVSRDGSTLAAFARNDGDDSFALWTATPPNAALERYPPAPFEAALFYGNPFLRFSPSGRKLLLIEDAADRGIEAWLVPFPADARNPPRRVLEDMPLLFNPEFSWLPDERHIVLAAGVRETRDLRRRLYLADTETGRYRVLTEMVNNPMIPVVSPDGSKLIVAENRIDSDIVTLDLATASVTTTIATDRSEILPAWAAEANAMVYTTDRSGAWEIWLHQAPQPDRPLVTASDFATATAILFAPTLSADGTRVIFHRVAEDGESRLWISAVDVAGGDPEPLTNESLTERAGSWSPDGESYVYWASPPDGGVRTLKKVRTTGRATPETVLEDLQFGPISPPAPVWSPDGRFMLVAHQGLTLLSVDGGPPRNVTSEQMPCAFAEAEPLLYCIRGSLGAVELGDYALVVLDFDGNVERMTPLPPAYRPISELTPGLRLSLTPDKRGVTYSVVAMSVTLALVEGLDRFPLP